MALAVAGTGTAVAATSTTTISDPTNSSYVAHVNSSGQLQVTGPVSVSTPTSSFLATAFVGDYGSAGLQVVLGPTVATLALTQVGFNNPGSNAQSWDDFLVEESAASSSACTTSITSSLRIGTLDAAPGVDDEQNFTPPFVVKPITAGKYYCILAEADTSSGNPDTRQTVSTIRGYVISGTAPVSPSRTTSRLDTGS